MSEVTDVAPPLDAAALIRAAKAETGLEDFGEANLLGDNGATNYVRVDWFTPKGLSTWGDGRMIIMGEKGYIELRKYLDVARDKKGDHVFLVDETGEHYFNVDGKVGFRFQLLPGFSRPALSPVAFG